MKRKVRFIAALFCMGCLATEPAADIKAAGIQVAAAQTTLSADNSLEVLSLSAGTLSPDFTGKTVQYTATVPNDVTSVTVTATPVNEFATVQSITGNDNLQVGTNTIKVVVKAQNGALAQYTITLTREDGQTADGTVDQPADGTDGQTTDQPADGTDSQTTDQPADGTDGQAADQNAEFETEEAEDVSNMEYLQQEYNDLSEQYAKEKSFSRNMMGIMAFVIAVLVVIIINLLLRGRKSDDWDEEEDDWDWKSEKQGKDQEAEDDTDLEEDDNIEENPGVEEDDLEVDDPEDADWEEKETQRKGFFHRKPKEKVEDSSFPSIVRFDTVPELNACIVPFSYFARTPTNIPTPSVSLLSDTFAFDTSTFTFVSTVFEFCFVLVTAISVSLPSLRPARIPTPLSDVQFPALSFSPF